MAKPRTRTAQKTGEPPSDASPVTPEDYNGIRSDAVWMDVDVIETLKALTVRMGAMETKVDLLAHDVGVLKSIPGAIAAHETVINTHAARIDKLYDSLGELIMDMPRSKSKKRFGIF